MDAIEHRAERLLAGLPDYVWAGDAPPIPIDEIADTRCGSTSATAYGANAGAGIPELPDDETISGLLIPTSGDLGQCRRGRGLADP